MRILADGPGPAGRAAERLVARVPTCYDACDARLHNASRHRLRSGAARDALSGCGDDTKLPQAVSTTPFATSTVAITQKGNADATIDAKSVSFRLDDSRSLVVHATLTSHASSMMSVSVRASLYDPSHNVVGDAIGGPIKVQPGQPATLNLSGPTPLGTIASALFEVSGQPSPT